MCATNLWAINTAAFTPAFSQFTAETLGIAPAVTELRIASSRVRKSSPVFTLTHNMCDCNTLVGRRNEPPVDGETSADAWLRWFRELPAHVPHVSRVAVLRAWSPETYDVVPARSRGISVSDISEGVLRDLRDENLLTIDYPRSA